MIDAVWRAMRETREFDLSGCQVRDFRERKKDLHESINLANVRISCSSDSDDNCMSSLCQISGRIEKNGRSGIGWIIRVCSSYNISIESDSTRTMIATLISPIFDASLCRNRC